MEYCTSVSRARVRRGNKIIFFFPHTSFENCTLRNALQRRLRFCDEGGGGRCGTRGYTTEGAIALEFFHFAGVRCPFQAWCRRRLSLQKYTSRLLRLATNSCGGVVFFASRPSLRPFLTYPFPNLGHSSSLRIYTASRTCLLAAPVAHAESSLKRGKRGD